MKNYRITVNGNVYDVVVEETAGGVAAAPVAAQPKAVPVPAAPQVPVPAAPAAPQVPVQTAPAASGTQGGVKVTAPMPGKILAVKANVGQAVKRGDVIIVLEAMKMENEIVAPEDGTIASIEVSEGKAIEAGDILATLN